MDLIIIGACLPLFVLCLIAVMFKGIAYVFRRKMNRIEELERENRQRAPNALEILRLEQQLTNSQNMLDQARQAITELQQDRNALHIEAAHLSTQRDELEVANARLEFQIAAQPPAGQQVPAAFNYAAGVLSEVMNLFPVQTLQEEQISALNENRQECSICLTAYAAGSQVMELACGHMFHEECIRQWLSTHMTCPLDNINVMTQKFRFCGSE